MQDSWPESHGFSSATRAAGELRKNSKNSARHLDTFTTPYDTEMTRVPFLWAFCKRQFPGQVKGDFHPSADLRCRIGCGKLGIERHFV